MARRKFPERILTTYRIPKAIIDRLRAEAIEKNMSLNALVTQKLRESLA